jgi:tetratricopeptide (TPR) repeat protein
MAIPKPNFGRTGRDHEPARRCGRRGFIIWGSKNRVRTTDAVGVRATCPKCEVESQFVEKQLVTYFHVYWIPLFPIHRGLRFVECEYCHAQFEMGIDGLRAIEEEKEREQAADAAARRQAAEREDAELETLRETWPAHPEDRVSLARLLDLLASKGRYPDIGAMEDAVRQRYGEDPDLVLRLAHAAFATKRYAAAARDYESILEKNPYRGDARFYLASSYWSMQPPDWDRALEQMQIASDMGYQPAIEALPKLKQARGAAG